MLRASLLGLGGLLLAGAVAASFLHVEVAVPLAIGGALLVLGILFERHSYKPPTANRPGPGWHPTGERFIDPASGEKITVYENPTTSERRYVSHGKAP